MTSKIVAFILGIVIGAGVCAAVLSKSTNRHIATVIADERALSSNRVTALESSLNSARVKLRQAEQDNDTLSARVQELTKKQAADVAQAGAEKPTRPKGLAALFGGDGTNGMSQAMTEMMRSAAEQQMETKISGMKTKLGLSAEQEQAIREIMLKQAGKGTELAQKMFKGELSKEDMEKLSKDRPNQKDEIKALLTADQSKAYDEFEKEEQSRMVRLAANAELLQMQSQLQLTDEQQDKVFAALTEYAQGQMEGKDKDPSSPLDFRGQFEKKAEALKGVLTPEQFERYRKFQEQQVKLIESFMPKSSDDKATATPQ